MLNLLNKHSIKILFSLFLGYNIILVVFSHDGFPKQMKTELYFPYLADKPVSEDAYYMLTLAWNFANGEGLVYNYHQASTGVQPLVTFIYSVFAFVIQFFELSKWEFIRVVLAFNILLIPLFNIILVKLLNKLIVVTQEISLFLFLICIYNYDLYRNFVYGLETGVYMILFSSLILLSINYFEAEKTLGKTIILGIIIGIVIITRIDFIIVVSSFIIIMLFLKKIDLTNLSLILITSLIIILPWFLYVYSVTGSIIPSSGTAQARFISLDFLTSRFVDIIVAITTHVSPWLFSGGSLKIALIGLSFTILLFIYKKRMNLNWYLGLSKNSHYFFIWLLSFCSLIPIYFSFFWATHFYIRYTAPLLIFILPMLAIVLSHKLKNAILKVVFISAILTLYFAQNFYAFHMGRISNSHTITTGFIKETFDESVKIGAFQSGIIGFFNENVVNLDGKMNSRVINSINENKLGAYLDSENIQIIIDWESYIHNYINESYLNENWDEIKKLNNFTGKEVSICLFRKGYPSSSN